MVKTYIFTSTRTSPHQIVVTGVDASVAKSKIAKNIKKYLIGKYPSPESWVDIVAGRMYKVKVIEEDGTEISFDRAEGNIW